MPFYQYSVKNNQGQTVLGTLQAENSDAARVALTAAGYGVQMIEELASNQPRPAKPKANSTAQHVARSQAQVTIRPTPAVSTARVQAREAPSSAPVVNTIPAGPAKADTYKTKYGSDKDLFFLFSQLGSYFRSGINPVQSLNDLTHRTPSQYHDSLKHAGQVVSEGGRMSDVFEKYPYLYPPDVIGTIRAGEAAGFLPEAMDEISSKMELSHRLKRRLKYFNIMFILTVATTPIVLGIVEGGLKSIKEQDTAGGSLPVMPTLAQSVGTSFIHNAPATILIFLGIWGLIAWFTSMPMRGFRHKLVMRTPVIGGRAQAESMARMTWAMGMLSKAGLSPQQTFLLATQAVPNLAMRDRLAEEGNRLTESDKLSTALRRSELLPPEYGNIVETGEITGDVPRALEHVAKATDADFQGRNATAVTSSSFILYGILGVLILILSAWLLTKWYGGLIHTILPEGLISPYPMFLSIM